MNGNESDETVNEIKDSPLNQGEPTVSEQHHLRKKKYEYDSKINL